MKTLLVHRIDGLYKQAIAGNPEAQLKLAKEFVRGRIVEKSLDNARYWAFRAVNGGNSSAIAFYNSIASDYRAPLPDKIEHILSYVRWVPWIEIIGAFILLLILPFDQIVTHIVVCFIPLGILSLFLGAVGSKIIERLFGLSNTKGFALVLFIVHVIALIIACL